MLTRFLSSEPTQTNERTFRFKISDESKDRHGTIVKSDGWMLDNYNNNGIVAYNHNTTGEDPDAVIGRGRAWVENGVLWGEVELEPGNPVAEKVLRRLKFGTLKTASVGFDPMVWTKGNNAYDEDPSALYFRKQDLLEWSIVNIPSNTNALLQKAYGDFVQMAFEDIKVPDAATVMEAVRQADDINAAQAAEDAPAITGPDEFITKLLTVKMYQL